MGDNRTVSLTRGDSIGLTLVSESALISLIAVLGVFILLIRNAFRNGYLIKRPADLYMISLFAFDLVMALGHFVNVKWIHEGQVSLGSYCTAQGAMQQFGALGSSLSTLVIAIHTFVGVMWGKLGRNFVFAYCVVAFNWLFTILFVALGIALNQSSSRPYETPDGFWCWISPDYAEEQKAGQYAWLWATMVVSLITYTILFLWARGNLTVSPIRWWDIRIHHAEAGRMGTSGKARSVKMIAYPIVFTILVVPLSIVRFISGFGVAANHNVPHAATFAAQFIWSLSGAVNVMLFLTTRSGLFLPKSTNGIATTLVQPDAESDTEKEQKLSRGSVPREGGTLSLRYPHSTDMRSVERGERPVALAALPGVEYDVEDW